MKRIKKNTYKQIQATKENNERCIDLTHGRGFADIDLKRLVISLKGLVLSKPEVEVEDHVEVEHDEDSFHRQLSIWNLIKLKICFIWLSLVWFDSN